MAGLLGGMDFETVPRGAEQVGERLGATLLPWEALEVAAAHGLSREAREPQWAGIVAAG